MTNSLDPNELLGVTSRSYLFAKAIAASEDSRCQRSKSVSNADEHVMVLVDEKRTTNLVLDVQDDYPDSAACSAILDNSYNNDTKSSDACRCTFFMGENSSGKTSVFEGARRCLSLGQNTSLSSPHYPERLSSVICIFDINDEQGNSGSLHSANIRLPTAKEQLGGIVYVKAAFKSIGNELGVDLVKETKSKILVNEEVAVNGTIVDKFLKFQENPSHQHTNDLVKTIAESVSDKVDNFKTKTEITSVNTKTVCERLLRTYVDDFVVFTFSVRGVGPCQWSWSQRVTNDWKVKNYTTAQERAEILHWYLKKRHEKRLAVGDQEMVERHFNTITNYSGYTFHLTKNGDGKDELIAYNKIAGKRNVGQDYCKPMPIMKVPEGILEAMNSSILLGLSSFRTICLEEPEKGMHPQMIERMRDLVLRNIKEKNVLITSHHPYFLGPWTVPKLYIFKRSENDNGIAFKAYSGLLIEQSQVGKKTPRIITSEHFASVFFARRVLFVEGESDYLFMTSLKQLLLANDELVQMLINRCTELQEPGNENPPQTQETFRAFLCSLHIVSMNGETMKLKFHKLCHALNTEKYFLLDFDAIIDSNKTTCKFLEDFGLTEYDSSVVKDNVGMLEEAGVFVWNNCQFEHVLVDLAKRHNLEKFFKDEKCNLQFGQKGKTQKRRKLFREKDLTDENIATVVEKVIRCCLEDEDEQEMFRLLAFLYNKR